MADTGGRGFSGDASDRLPPQDLDAEQATLGAMLVAEEAASLTFSIVEAADFYREAHRLIFAAMKQVADRNEPSAPNCVATGSWRKSAAGSI